MAFDSTYLCLFAQEHVDFRVPEVISIASLHGVKLECKDGYKNESPFLEMTLPCEDDAKKLLSRSLSIKSLYELWGSGKTLDDLCENLKKYPVDKIEPYGTVDSSFRINVETYNKKIPQSKRNLFYEEVISIASLHGVKLECKDGYKNESPFLEMTLPCEDDAKKLLSRSLSIKSLYELWGSGKTLDDLCENLKKYPVDKIEPYGTVDSSFRINVETYNKKIPQSKRNLFYETLSFLPLEGKINLDNPDHIFSLILDFGEDANEASDEPSTYYFGRLIGKGQRHICQKYSLKTRHFIGNTSMDPLLSFLMANQCQARPGTLVYDPFVGTGSILLSCAHFGSHVFGSDIDKNIIQGRGKSSRANSKCKWRARDEVIRTNFTQAGLEDLFLDVLVADASRPVLRATPLFDAIVTDPPYGVREGVRKQEADKTVMDENRSEPPYPAIRLGRLSDVILSLLHFASQYLTLQGRLVFWLPVHRPSYSKEKVPRHPCFTLVANSEQRLFTNISRRLITMEKTQEYMESITLESLLLKNKEFENMCDNFRENYFSSSSS